MAEEESIQNETAKRAECGTFVRGGGTRKAVRPEDVRFEERGIRFSGKILTVEELGPQTIIAVETAEGNARLISDSDTHRIGESISFSISEEKTYLFRHPGGEALRPA